MQKLLKSLEKERYCIKIILKEKRVVLGKIDSHKLAILIDVDNIDKGKKLELNDMIQKNEIRLFRLSKDEVKGLQYV
jgi:sporulation-control protein spo0M